MTKEERLQDLLVRWLELCEEGQVLSAEQLCADCPELLDEVRHCLAKLRRFDPAGHAEEGHGLQAPHALSASANGQAAPAAPARAEHSFGKLRLHRRGGLGQVFRAVDEPLNREVALKRIVPERAEDPQSRRRFEREVALTAYLKHPGIIPIYSVGRDAAGPFYTMPFISGQTLGDAIAVFHSPALAGTSPTDRELQLRRLLERLRAVCHTMAYAHSRGVIHRDLKPSNILLGFFDETLVVDWGMARWVGQPEGALPETEGFLPGLPEDDISQAYPGHPVGTLEYMSPEQTEGRQRETPLSDVYSLGATLYHVLTGRPPFRKTEADPAELYRRIRAGEFPKPRQVRREAPAELEAVCLKAMALRPEDRYTGTRELAEEIERWLVGGPVRAWEEPWRLRVRRWMRLHPRTVTLSSVLIAAAAVVVLVIAVTVAVVSESGRREVEAQRDLAQIERDEKEFQRQKAVAARDHAREVLELMFSEGMLEVFEKQKHLTHGMVELMQELLTLYARSFEGEASDQNERLRQARGYVRIGYLQQRLGHRDAAVAAYQRAIELQKKLAEDFSTMPDYCRELAKCHTKLGIALAQLSRFPEAEGEFRRARELWQRLAADFPGTPSYSRELAANHNNLGLLLAEVGRRTEAEQEYRKALELQMKLVPDFLTVPKFYRELAGTHNNLGNLLAELGRRLEAENEYRSSLKLLQKLADDSPAHADFRADLALGRNNLGLLLKELDRNSEAETEYRLALEMQKNLVAEFPALPDYRQDLAASHANFGFLLKVLNRRPEAKEEYHRALEIQKKLVVDFPNALRYAVHLANGYSNYGTLLAEDGMLQESLDWYDQAVAALMPVMKKRPQFAEARRFLRNAYSGRAASLDRLGRYSAAAADWQRAVELDEQKPSRYSLAHAQALTRTGQPTQAVAVAEELSKSKGATGNTLHDCARVFALAAAAAKEDAALHEQYATRAVALLREAVAKGFKDFQGLREHADLEVLRSRKDFQDLRAELEKKHSLPSPGK